MQTVHRSKVKLLVTLVHVIWDMAPSLFRFFEVREEDGPDPLVALFHDSIAALFETTRGPLKLLNPQFYRLIELSM